MNSAGISRVFTFVLVILIVAGAVAATAKFTSKRTIKPTPAGATAYLRGQTPPARPINQDEAIRNYMNRVPHYNIRTETKESGGIKTTKFIYERKQY